MRDSSETASPPVAWSLCDPGGHPQPLFPVATESEGPSEHQHIIGTQGIPVDGLKLVSKPGPPTPSPRTLAVAILAPDLYAAFEEESQP